MSSKKVMHQELNIHWIKSSCQLANGNEDECESTINNLGDYQQRSRSNAISIDKFYYILFDKNKYEIKN